jgi:hypothetical protein
MKGLIIFRCPFTDMNVQTPLEKRESNPAGALEAFYLPGLHPYPPYQYDHGETRWRWPRRVSAGMRH